MEATGERTIAQRLGAGSQDTLTSRYSSGFRYKVSGFIRVSRSEGVYRCETGSITLLGEMYMAYGDLLG